MHHLCTDNLNRWSLTVKILWWIYIENKWVLSKAGCDVDVQNTVCSYHTFLSKPHIISQYVKKKKKEKNGWGNYLRSISYSNCIKIMWIRSELKAQEALQTQEIANHQIEISLSPNDEKVAYKKMSETFLSYSEVLVFASITEV